MITLLYETVTTFKNTWIKCLKNLTRYCMIIKNNDIQDQEVWNKVARFWYSKTADKSLNVRWLYHYLVILARSFSLQQLSLYIKFLTCVTSFESVRDSIMILFTLILNGKNSACYWLSSLKNVFIKAYEILFFEESLNEFDNAIQQLKNDLLNNYIERVTAKFKEQDVFVTVINSAALFEYEALKQSHLHKSIFRLAFEKVDFQRNQQTNSSFTHSSAEYFDVNDDATHRSFFASANSSAFDNLIDFNIKSSKIIISHASSITFTTLTISLLRIDDKMCFLSYMFRSSFSEVS